MRRMIRRSLLFGSTLVIATALIVSVTARPNRYGHSDRDERHLMPAVSSGPLDPAWSPDGKWMAFSMRGDIWKVPADGGEAIAVTRAPRITSSRRGVLTARGSRSRISPPATWKSAS